MRPFKFMLLAGCAAVAGCQQASDDQSANQSATVQPKRERTPYCFFKDDETKDWKASVDKEGNVVVRGKAYRQDSRYKAVLDKPKVEGANAEVWPTVVANDARYGAPEDWWPIDFTIPGSAAVRHVAVRCGAKTFASLDVPRKN
jgi:hypothetical protein